MTVGLSSGTVTDAYTYVQEASQVYYDCNLHWVKKCVLKKAFSLSVTLYPENVWFYGIKFKECLHLALHTFFNYFFSNIPRG